MARRALVLAVLTLLPACSSSSTGTTTELDSAAPDSASADSGATDTALPDSAADDTSAVDSTVADTSAVDSTAVDTAVADAATADTAVADTKVADAVADAILDASDAAAPKAKASLVQMNAAGINVALSSGTAFAPFGSWLTGAFFGDVANLAGDVDGDGKADLVGVPSTYEVYVVLSSGSSFGTPTKWTTGIYKGTKATLLGDVNGDGKADLVAINDTTIGVRLSTGSAFAAETIWSLSGFVPGNKVNLLADVTGDGKADLVLIDQAVGTTPAAIWVSQSTGTGFFTATKWLAGAFYGEDATVAGDLDGDGKADLVGFNHTFATYVARSTGSAFASNVQAASAAFFGAKANLVGDVDGDGKADLVAVDADKVRVGISSGSFATNALIPATIPVWFTGVAYGDKATLVAKVK